MYWVFLALTVVFFILMIRHSLGNVMEIINLLDKETLTGEQLAENYAYLVEKYGEWTVIGKNGGLFQVEFIDIRAALFSGLMITFLILSIVCFIVAVVTGKILFPKLAQLYKDNNQDMVNMATLQTNAEIQKRKTKKDEEWF
jgi:hypothetical protein